MLLPNGPVTVDAESSAPKPAFLVKFPEDVWANLEAAARSGGDVQISLDGSMSLLLPDSEPLPLEARTMGNTTEIHHFSTSSSSLTPLAHASTRLTVPLTSSSTARAADKLKQQHEAHDKERKERADRVNGVTKPSAKLGAHLAAPTATATTMTRTQSTPTMSAGSAGASAGATAPAAPMIPLKTRVVQLLALGPSAVTDIVKRVGGAEQDVMRVVKVVGKSLPTPVPSYTLDPAQYSKIKIANWKYTYAEKRRVIDLARTAFDELGLPAEAEERFELDRKEAEALSGSHASGSGSSGEGSSSSSASDNNVPYTPASAHLPIPVSEPSPRKPVSVGTTGSAEPEMRGKGHKGKEKEKEKERDHEKEKEKVKPVPKEKKEKPAPTKFGKQIAKFRAESAKRATSLPNTKAEAGTASPRLGSAVPVTEVPPVKEEAAAQKRKRDDVVKSRRRSRDYTSSEGEGEDAPLRMKKSKTKTKEKEKEEERGRGRDVKTARGREAPTRAGKDEAKGSVRTGPSRQSSSIEGEDEVSPTIRAKQPSPITSTRTSLLASVPKPSGHALPPKPKTAEDLRSKQQSDVSVSVSVTATDMKTTGPPKDPEELRERYEELMPAYQLLTQRLVSIHQACEDVEAGAGGAEAEVGKEELGKLVKRWERWHKELEGIRRWFGGDAG